MALSNAIPIEQERPTIPYLSLVGAKKKVKYNKDGSVNRSKCNKVAGKDSEVYAFRTKEEIAAMIQVFDNHIADATNANQKQIAYRNKLLFLVGMNVGIRGSDLRTLKWSFFFEKSGDELEWRDFYSIMPLKQRKKNKFVKLWFNQTVRTAVGNYIAEYPIESLDDYVFASRKGDEPIEAKSIYRIVKDTAAEAGIKQNIGAHSLRKSFGFWIWHEAKDKNKALVMLQMIFNHSSTQTTARYIGITDDEIADMFNSIELGLEMIL